MQPSEEDKEKNLAEGILSNEFASDYATKANAKIDTRRTTKMPVSLAFALSWFSTLDDYDGGEYMRELAEEVENRFMSVDGWNKEMMVKFMTAIKGASVMKYRKRPGWWGRNVSDRNYEEKASAEGVEIID